MELPGTDGAVQERQSTENPAPTSRTRKTARRRMSSSVEGESRVEVRLPEAQVLELFNTALEMVAPHAQPVRPTAVAPAAAGVKTPMGYDVRVPTDLRRG